MYPYNMTEPKTVIEMQALIHTYGRSSSIELNKATKSRKLVNIYTSSSDITTDETSSNSSPLPSNISVICQLSQFKTDIEFSSSLAAFTRAALPSYSSPDLL